MSSYLQNIHHLCLKLKHAANSNKQRVSLKYNKLNLQISNILYREGFLSNVLAGDEQGPFVETLPKFKKSHVSLEPLYKSYLMNADILKFPKIIENFSEGLLTRHQEFQLQTLLRTYCTIQQLQNGTLEEAKEKFNIPVIPPLLKLPPEKLSLYSTADLHMLTEKKYLYLDIRYISHMQLISKNSRHINMTLEELVKKRSSSIGGSEIVFVMLPSNKGRKKDREIVSIDEAIRRGVGGEVVCMAR